MIFVFCLLKNCRLKIVSILGIRPVRNAIGNPLLLTTIGMLMRLYLFMMSPIFILSSLCQRGLVNVSVTLLRLMRIRLVFLSVFFVCNRPFTICILGNKCDLVSPSERVKTSDAQVCFKCGSVSILIKTRHIWGIC